MNTSPRYCLHCGTPLESRSIEGRPRAVCPNCGWIFYRQLKVGAGAMVENQGRLLLVRRAHPPWQESWNLPAGYVENDENPARAAEREVLEETGLMVQSKCLVETIFYDDDPRGAGLLLVYTAEIKGGRVHPTDEAREPRFFAPEEIPPNLAGGGHQPAIQAWQAQNGNLPEAKG